MQLATRSRVPGGRNCPCQIPRAGDQARHPVTKRTPWWREGVMCIWPKNTMCDERSIIYLTKKTPCICSERSVVYVTKWTPWRREGVAAKMSGDPHSVPESVAMRANVGAKVEFGITIVVCYAIMWLFVRFGSHPSPLARGECYRDKTVLVGFLLKQPSRGARDRSFTATQKTSDGADVRGGQWHLPTKVAWIL